MHRVVQCIVIVCMCYIVAVLGCGGSTIVQCDNIGAVPADYRWLVPDDAQRIVIYDAGIAPTISMRCTCTPESFRVWALQVKMEIKTVQPGQTKRVEIRHPDATGTSENKGVYTVGDQDSVAMGPLQGGILSAVYIRESEELFVYGSCR